MENSFEIIKNYTNEQLRSLVKEMHEIGKLDAPAHAKLSPEMQMLFDSQKDYGFWINKYHNVNISIDWEIKRRIVEDRF